MKKLIIRMLRSFKTSVGQFWSMVFVIAIGSAFFSGLLAAQKGMTDFVNRYFEAQNMADVWCYFNGITSQEIEDLFSSPDVRNAVGRYAYLASLTMNGVQSELLIRSMTDINVSLLAEGEMPKDVNEIVIDFRYRGANGIEIGDVLDVRTANGLQGLTVTGVCYNPEAILVAKNDYTASVSHAAFGIAYGTNETLLGLNRQSEIYQNMLSTVSDSLSDAKQQLNDAQQQIASKRAEYEEARETMMSELANVQDQLENSSQQIEEGSAELSSQRIKAAQQIQDFQKQLDSARKEFNEVKIQAEAELAVAKEKLDSAANEIVDGEKSLAQQKADGKSQLDEALALLTDGKSKLAKSKQEDGAELAAAKTKLDDARKQLDEETAKYKQSESEGTAKLKEAEDKIKQAEKQLKDKTDQGTSELESGQAQLDAAYAQILSGEDEIRKAKDQVTAAQAELTKAAADLDAADKELNKAYLDYQAVRHLLTNQARAEKDAEFESQFFLLDQKKVEYNNKKSQADIQIASTQNLIAAKEKELAQGKADYAKAEKEFNTKKADAQSQAGDAQKEIDKSRAELTTQTKEAQAKLDEAKAALAKGEAEYRSGLQEYNAKKADADKQWADAQSEIDAKQKEYDQAQADANKKIAEAETKLKDAKSEYASGQKEWEEKNADAETQIAETEAELDAQQKELSSKKKQADSTLSQKEKEILAAQQAYEEGLDEFNDKKENLESQLSEAESELYDKEQEVGEKTNEYEDKAEDAQTSLENAVTSYQEVLLLTSRPDAVTALAKTNENYITTIERKNHTSYVAVEDSLDPLRKLSVIFPIVFFFVAAVIAFISISKMVDTQRTQIAVMRAIGVPLWKILTVYLLYAFIASLLGTIAFSILGNLAIPQYLIGAFTTNLEMPQIDVPIYPAYALLVLPVAFLFTGSAVLIATRKVLMENPAQGMRPFAPPNAKAILLEKIGALWSHLSATDKMAFRSMFRNKARILLSSTGVVGSVALLILGFSMREIALDVLKQTLTNNHYDLVLDLEEPAEDYEDIIIPADVAKREWTDIRLAAIQLDSSVPMKVQIMEPNSVMMSLFDSRGKVVPIEKDSFIIPQSLADKHGLKIGGSLLVEIYNTTYTFVITGICEQPLAKTLFLGVDAAAAVGIEMEKRIQFIKLKDEKITETVAEELRKDMQISGVGTRQGYIDFANEIMSMLNALIAIIIVASMILGIAVVYNVSSVNILERTREYAAVLALGYSINHISRMIILENVFQTIIGSIIGTPLGYFLYQYLRDAVSRDDLTLGKQLTPFAAFGAIVVSCVLMAITNRLLRGKITGIPLAETLRTTE